MFFYSEREETIVTDGLTLHLDAADVSSYPGTGTIWTDLTGNHGTFNILGPSFEVEGDNKYFLFGNDQVDRITQANSTVFADSNIYTTEYWLKSTPGTPSGQTFYTLISYNVGTTNEILHYYFGTDVNVSHRYVTGPTSTYVSSGVYNQASDKTIWHQLVIVTSPTQVLLYVNGTLRVTKTRVENYTFRTGYFVFGQEQDSEGGSFQTSQDFNGSLSQIRVYKGKALSAAEVLQNFNVTRVRFGL